MSSKETDVNSVLMIVDEIARRCPDVEQDLLNQLMEHVSAYLDQSIKSSQKVEHQLNKAQQLGRIGSWEFDLQNGTVQASPEACRIYGVDPTEQMTIAQVQEMVLPEYRTTMDFQLEKLVQGLGDYEVEFQIRRFNDGMIVDLFSVAEYNPADHTITGIIHDISLRNRIKKKLQESEQKFKSLFNDHSAVKLIIDPDDGQIVEANTAATRFYGWTVHELKRMKIYEINTLSSEQLRKEIEIARSSKNIHFEFKHRLYSGAIRDVEVFSSGVQIDGKEYLYSIIHDVTAKKEAERQLRLLSASVEQTPVSVIITDCNGRIEYVNPAFSRTTGYSREDVLGKNPRILKSGHHDQEFYAALWHTILSGRNWRGEVRNKKKNGETVWENMIISPIQNSEKKLTHFVCIKEDVSGKKRMIDDLIRAKNKAEENERLKTAFLSNMSHEIRTPMNGIIGFIDLLNEPDITQEDRGNYMQLVNQSGLRLLATINNIVDFSKIESGQMSVYSETVDVSGVLDYIYNFFRDDAQKNNQEFSVSIDSPKHRNLSLVTDKNKLISILTNFVRNAFKFAPKGSIHLLCKVEKNQVVFSVSDTGRGIAPDQFDNVFKRFVQVFADSAPLREGTGLGLTICKAFAEMLDGTVWVESVLGEGSTFFLSLPRK